MDLKEKIYIAISTFLFGIISIYTKYRLNERAKKREYLKEKIIPIINEIVEDLKILEQAFIYRGIYCSKLDKHRAPTLSCKDGDGHTTMSYAQRAHQFKTIGDKITKNCNIVLSSTREKNLPKTWKICKEIKNYLCTQKTPSSNTLLVTLINHLIGYLSQDLPAKNRKSYENDFDYFHKKLHALITELEESVKNELSKKI